MKEIIEYKIVSGNNEWVSNRINVLIEDGWQPFGSPYFTSANHCQAMVKYEKDEQKQLND